MFDAEFTEKLMTAGQCPCPRCGKAMAEYLEICCNCQWTEAEQARRQETFDALYNDAFYADMDAREADGLDLADTQASVMASMRGW